MSQADARTSGCEKDGEKIFRRRMPTFFQLGGPQWARRGDAGSSDKPTDTHTHTEVCLAVWLEAKFFHIPAVRERDTVDLHSMVATE